MVFFKKNSYWSKNNLFSNNLTYFYWKLSGNTFTFAFREVVETVGALVTQFSAEVLFAGTLPSGVFALSVPGSFEETVARFAIGVSVVSFAASVAVRRGEGWLTLALSEAFRTVSGRIVEVAVASWKPKSTEPWIHWIPPGLGLWSWSGSGSGSGSGAWHSRWHTSVSFSSFPTGL